MARATKTPVKPPAKKTRPPVSRKPRTEPKPVPNALAHANAAFGKDKAKAAEEKVEVKAIEPAPRPTPPAPVWTPCEVSATWADWMDATRRAAFGSRRLVLPVLCAVFITVDEYGSVIMRSTDLEVSVQTTLPTAFIDGPGPLLVNAARLLDALKGIKGGLTAAKANCERVSVIRSKNGDTLVTGFGRSLLLLESTVTDEDYPAWPKHEVTRVAHLPSGQFVDGLEFAFAAAGEDDTLPMLNAVLMTTVDGPLTFVGTDRYRLAVNPVSSAATETFGVLIPRSARPWLRQLTGAVDMWLEVPKKIGTAEQPPQIAKFVSGNVTVWTRLTDASFPPYKSLIPTDGVSWRIDRLQLAGDVTAAKSIVDRKAPVRVTFDAGKYQVDGCEIHSAEGGDENTMVTSFNPDYLLAGLRLFACDEVTLTATMATKPFLITGQRSDHEALYLIMPVRLPG